jgi:hypothetical protein
MKDRSRGRGETKDCSVISMALVAGITYDESHALFAKCGRTFRHGTSAKKVDGVFYELGIKHKRSNIEGMTFQTILCTLKPEGKYLLISKRHSAAVINRKIVDWSDNEDKEVVTLVEIL